MRDIGTWVLGLVVFLLITLSTYYSVVGKDGGDTLRVYPQSTRK